MKYRKETLTGDMLFGGGEKCYSQNTPEAVGLLVKNRIELWWKEWFLDPNEGTPFPVGKLDKKMADEIVRNRILGSYGVKDIIYFESTMDEKRTMHYTVTINTIYGTTQEAGDLLWL